MSFASLDSSRMVLYHSEIWSVILLKDILIQMQSKKICVEVSSEVLKTNSEGQILLFQKCTGFVVQD